MSEAQKSSLKKKFEIAHFLAKEELSFQKYKRLLELEKFHDVPHEREYGNANQCANFIKLIAETVAGDLCADIKKSHFLSVLWDGITTVDTKECEGCFVQYLDVTGDGPEVELKTRFLGLEHVTRDNAVEILAALINALEKLGVEDFKDRLVGLGADGASINSGEENEVVGLARYDIPWVPLIWCFLPSSAVGTSRCNERYLLRKDRRHVIENLLSL
jgi:hypothetical protein